jgi:hypothetical protein
MTSPDATALKASRCAVKSTITKNETMKTKNIPRRPWLLSKQHSMTFVLSQDNEIVLGSVTCKHLGDNVLNYIIEAVNTYSPNTTMSSCEMMEANDKLDDSGTPFASSDGSP